MDINIQTRNVLIILGTLSGLGVIIAFIRTWKWFSRSGRQIIDLATIGKFFLHILGILGTVLLFVTSGVSVWWLVFYKKQYEANFPTTDTSSFENLLRILLIVSFILKTIDIIHMIIRQIGIDVFFMDWERSKTGNLNSVSAWRMYFAANEFNEIQTFRRINVLFQLFFVLFFLKVINLENISYAQSSIDLLGSADNSATTTTSDKNDFNNVFRIGIAFLTLLGTALIQYFVYIIFYQRVIADKILNFVDLCSVSNISVFILDQAQHGYYIHGRSPHGITDVNMKEIVMNLFREQNQMSGTRGLQDNSNDQTFIIRINRSFRKQYEVLFRSYSNYTGPRKTREDAERGTDMLLQSYQNLNGFLCAFIDHSLASHQYHIRNRFFLEKLLNYEFQVRSTSSLPGNMDNLLFIDKEKAFTQILFYGEESSLFIWNMATFLFVDFLSTNYVLAAIITYLLNSIFVGIRNSFGRKNLSKKTLIPREFLI